MQMSNKNAAIEFLTMVACGEVDEAYRRHVAADFRHHNPYFPHERQALLDGMAQSAAAEPGKSLEIIRAVEEADVVAVHSRLARADAGMQYAVVHLVRFEAGKIVELWDIAQEVPDGSPNAIGMF